MHKALSGFLQDVQQWKTQYKKTGDFIQFHNELVAAAPRYAGYFGLGDWLLQLGEEYLDEGDRDGGMAVIRAVCSSFPHVANQVTLYLRMAQYHLENGETDSGAVFLRKLCTETVENYEEAIAHNGLTAVWEAWRHLAPEPESLSLLQSRPIEELWNLPEDEVLAALSERLGEKVERNHWEQTFFYADELCMEVNSSGFWGYLYYNGAHFEKAQQAFATLQTGKMRWLMKQVQNKFPRGCVPKDPESIQNILDGMEEAGIDFEAEDAVYYESAEPELLEALQAFVRTHREKFR